MPVQKDERKEQAHFLSNHREGQFLEVPVVVEGKGK